MDLQDLAMLVEVVRVGSVQRAARLLRVSRSTVRRQLTNLEDAVGTALLVRDSSSFALTPAGLVVVEEGRSLLGQGERLKARATSRGQTSVGTVRLIVPTGIRRDVRLMVLERLHQANPDLRIVERESDDPLTLIHEPFDLLAYIGGPPPEGNWYSRVLVRAPFRLFAARAYLERAGTPEDVSELAAHPLAMWQSRDLNPEELPLLAGGVAQVSPWYVSRNLENVMAAVGRGMGIGLGPVFMDNEGLVPILTGVVGTEQTVRSLSPNSISDDLRVRAFHQSVKQFLAALPSV